VAQAGQDAPAGRGPDFFEHGVTDDPQLSPIYDPHLDPRSAAEVSSLAVASRQGAGSPQDALYPVAAEEEQQPPLPPMQPVPGGAPGELQAPRSTVYAQGLEQLGVIVVSGNNPQDIALVMQIIKRIQELAQEAEIKVEMVPLRYGDATNIANSLNALYTRVVLTAAGPTTLSQPRSQTTAGGFGVNFTTTQSVPASVFITAIPRFNAILIAAPGTRLKDVETEIKRLDQPNSPEMRLVPFQLKKAPANRVASLINTFWTSRYPNETLATHQVRVTYDDSSNTVWVQASPADMEEIRGLVEELDSFVSASVDDIRIVPLRNALSDDLANLLLQAIAAGVLPPTSTAGAVPAAPGAAPGGIPGGGPGGPPGAFPGGGVLPGAGGPGAAGAAARLGAAGALGTTPLQTKSTSLRFISSRRDAGAIESGFLEDIHIISDPRTNSLILMAPSKGKAMDLLLALIRDLDVAPSARAEINVFKLKRADATTMALMLNQLLLGTGGAAGGARPAGAGGLPGGLPGGGLPGGGLPGGLPGAVPGAGALGAGGAARPLSLITLGGVTPEGYPLIELRLTADTLTNSLIAAGSPNDLDIIAALVDRLDNADVQQRINEVYHLKNVNAADLAAALNSLLPTALQVYQVGGQLMTFQELLMQVVVVPEAVTNSLLISASPQFFGEVIRLIKELDCEIPMVAIQILVAEVDLSSDEEVGCELGLQSPVLFQRGVIPAFPFLNDQLSPGNLLGSTGSVNYANATGGLVPPGVTVNTSVNPTALPSYLFNTTSPLPTNPVVSPGLVGFQGITNLGVGRASPTSGVGGFVFSASSDSVSINIRALKVQGRIDILSRPQVTTLDNQSATVVVGQSVPITLGSNITATGVISNNVQYRDVGVRLDVTPKITPDNKVYMRVFPEISSPVPTQVNLGNGVLATAFNTQYVQTTVLAGDGETVAIGGMISTTDTKNENKVPWLGDLSGIGALFRYRTQNKKKVELLVLMTPHIVRSRAEADRVLAEEATRIDWMLGSVLRIHGTSGMQPVIPPPGAGKGKGAADGRGGNCASGNCGPAGCGTCGADGPVVPVPVETPPLTLPGPAEAAPPPSGAGPGVTPPAGQGFATPPAQGRPTPQGFATPPQGVPGTPQGFGTTPTPLPNGPTSPQSAAPPGSAPPTRGMMVPLTATSPGAEGGPVLTPPVVQTSVPAAGGEAASVPEPGKESNRWRLNLNRN
jgi:type II secretory pathway component GspD/PulD (secretin)